MNMAIASVMAMGGLASADMVVPVYDKAPTTQNPFAGSVSAGYSSNYVSRGLVLAGASNDNAIPVSVDGQFALGNQYSIVAGIKYTELIDNGFKHSRRDGVSDEGTGIFGLRRDWCNGLTTTLSYQYVNGGIINVFHPADGRGRDIFNSHKSEEHSVVFDINYDLTKAGLKGAFWASRVQYAARWDSGWWFTNTLGYKFDLCSRASAVVSATWDVSAGYFDAKSINANGTQGVSLNLDIPIKVCDCVTVKPFVGTVWSGNGAHRAGNDMYRNFTVVGGVSATYVF